MRRHVQIQEIYSEPAPLLPEGPGRELLTKLLLDVDGVEDYYLSEIEKAAAGQSVPGLHNNIVLLNLQIENATIIDIYKKDDDPSAQLEIPLSEIKELIQDWQAARAAWEREHRR